MWGTQKPIKHLLKSYCNYLMSFRFAVGVVPLIPLCPSGPFPHVHFARRPWMHQRPSHRERIKISTIIATAMAPWQLNKVNNTHQHTVRVLETTTPLRKKKLGL